MRKDNWYTLVNLPQGRLGLVTLAGAFAVYFFVVTWPISLLLVACILGWWLTRRQESPWGKVAGETLAPVAVGLGLVSILLFVLNTFKFTLDPAWLRTSEMALIKARMELRGWTSLKLPVFVAVIALLMVATYAFPKFRLVTRFFWLQKVASNTLLVLMTITTFTFFSQVPLERIAEREHKQAAERYRILIRQESDAVAEYLSVKTIEKATATLDEMDKQSFQQMFRTIDSARLDELPAALRQPFKRAVSADLAQRSGREALALPEMAQYSSQFQTDGQADLEPEKALDSMPTSSRGWESQLALLKEQESRTTNAELRSEEAQAGLTKIFSETIGLAMPEFVGIEGAYVKGLVSEYSEALFKKVVRKWRASRQPGSKTDLMPETPREVIESLLPHSVLARLFLVLSPDKAGGGAATPDSGSRAEIARDLTSKIESRVREEIESLKARERRVHENPLDAGPGEKLEKRVQDRMIPRDHPVSRGR